MGFKVPPPTHGGRYQAYRLTATGGVARIDPIPVEDRAALVATMKEISKKFPGFMNVDEELWKRFCDLAPRCDCGRMPSPRRLHFSRGGRGDADNVFCSSECQAANYLRRRDRRRFRSRKAERAAEAEALAEGLGFAR